MKSLGNYVGASIGFILLVCVIALSMSNTLHSAPPVEEKDVRVVNTAAEAVPVTVQGMPQLTGSVSVSNTPTVSAQQSGTWNVGISGTPTVSVGNPSSNPVMVRDVDNAKQPFMRTVNLVLGANESFKSEQFPACPNNPNLCSNEVPNGKLMVVEYVSAEAVNAPEGMLRAFIRRSSSAGLTDFPVVMHPQNSVFTAGDASTKLYFWPGEILSGNAQYNDVHTATSLSITISGYFMNLP